MACPAKVNLFLRVLAREADGYHNIETLFCRLALADTLDVRRTDGTVALEVDGADLGAAEDNLAWRAAQAVLDATGRRFGVALRLAKRIPHGAGLGGGSSDAASALLAVNHLANNAVPRAELLRLAHRLGADVPFFVAEAPLAVAWGHGQRMVRLPPLPQREVLLLIPARPILTAEAYRWVDDTLPAGGRAGITMDLDVLGNWSDIARLAGNDFESAAFARHPELREAFEALARTRPLLCRMSGSGSALFGVYRDARERDAAAEQLGTRYGRLIATRTG
jgi:4-diphosphocytidyl-2-C-methyl-D-erythritol kinase